VLFRSLLEENLTDTVPIEELSSFVHRTAGFLIHRSDNYESTEQFRMMVNIVSQKVKSLYETSKESSHELFKFFCCALNYNGCFEGRVERVLDYEEGLCSILKNLQYEAQLMQNIFKSTRPIELDTFLSSLRSNGFKFPMEEELSKDHPTIQTLISRGYIKGSQTTNEKILDYISLYDYNDPTIKGFKRYLLEQEELTTYEKENISTMLADFFENNPQSSKHFN